MSFRKIAFIGKKMPFPAINLDVLLCEARGAALGIEHFMCKKEKRLGLHSTPQVIQLFAVVVEQYIVNIFDRYQLAIGFMSFNFDGPRPRHLQLSSKCLLLPIHKTGSQE